MKGIISSGLLLCLIILGSCDTYNSKYNINGYFSQQEQDTLMTNIVTYIYKVPKGADPKRKHDIEYRKLYANQIPEFEFIYYHIEPSDSTHYFYLIRPARNAKGYKRGVLGKFKISNNLKFKEFEEIANTPMLAENEIKEKGKFLWEDLMYYNHVNRYVENKDYIEFPDSRVRYDKASHEWTYEK